MSADPSRNPNDPNYFDAAESAALAWEASRRFMDVSADASQKVVVKNDYLLRKILIVPLLAFVVYLAAWFVGFSQ